MLVCLNLLIFFLPINYLADGNHYKTSGCLLCFYYATLTSNFPPVEPPVGPPADPPADPGVPGKICCTT